ncbi:hypothetical protein WDW37_13630 [Bdellovibrionota bacterium FG-1]
MRLSLGLIGLLGFLNANAVFATDAIPVCPAFSLRNQNGGNPGDLPINNADVLKWKQATQNQFHARGHVQGNIVKVYPDRNGHDHFAIKIGPNDADTVEIIYNQDFGTAPDTHSGVPVEACGDYITSTAPSPGPNGQVYPASPDGALVHWVHLAPPRSGHHSGFLMIGGILVGQGKSKPGQKPRKDHVNLSGFSYYSR